MTGVNAIDLVSLSPLMAVNTLSEGIATHPSHAQWMWIGLLGFADLAVWIALALALGLRRDSSGDNAIAMDSAATASDSF